MLKKQEFLLLVSAMHFAVVGVAITKKVAPNICIIMNFDICLTIHQSPIYKLLESVLDAKWGWSPLVYGCRHFESVPWLILAA